MVFKRFRATVGQRMALWSVALGFVVSLFVANEFVASDRMDRLAAEMSVNAEALLRTEEASAHFEKIHSLADESLTRAEDWALVDDMAKAMSTIAAAAQGEVRERALQAEALLSDVRGQAGTSAGQKLMRQWPTVHEDMHRALNNALVDITRRLKAQTAGDLRLVAVQVEQVAAMTEQWRQTAEAAMLASTDLDRQAAGLRDLVEGFIGQRRRAEA